ncbi:MAG TPA: SRPBCC family protein, partial [Microlunatus sp.]
MGAAHDVIEVNVPISTAYNQWTQFESFPQFMNGVDEVRQLDDKHLHWKVSVPGVSREYDAEITEQRPDEVVAWQSSGDTDHSGSVVFESLDDNTTKIMASINYDTEGVAEKAGDVLNVPQRQLKNDLARFKDFIEARGGETG